MRWPRLYSRKLFQSYLEDLNTIARISDAKRLNFVARRRLSKSSLHIAEQLSRSGKLVLTAARLAEELNTTVASTVEGVAKALQERQSRQRKNDETVQDVQE